MYPISFILNVSTFSLFTFHKTLLIAHFRIYLLAINDPYRSL